jgi:hypothetical protein
MTGAAATTHTRGRTTSSSPAGALYVVRVVDSVDERLAGHGSCAYTSPAQPCGDALALAQLLLGGAVAIAGGSERWTRRVAIAGGRRTVTLERIDGTR